MSKYSEMNKEELITTLLNMENKLNNYMMDFEKPIPKLMHFAVWVVGNKQFNTLREAKEYINENYTTT